MPQYLDVHHQDPSIRSTSRASPGDDPQARELSEKLARRHRLIGRSPAFLDVARRIPRLAACDIGVLISGETGTGKELVARAIHGLGPRAHGPFVPVNCGAIPHDLVENELFGHERGAFTGADRARPGLLEEAHGGTLLLDEVDSLPLLAQVKILRFLQERELRRLGSTRTRTADVRVIAASNADIAQAVAEGQLRSDLFYRLNVMPLELPPLRDRREDILPLAEYFLERCSENLDHSLRGFDSEARTALLRYEWPGNVRELENVVQRSVVLAASHSVVERRQILLPCCPNSSEPLAFKEAKARAVAHFERRYIETLLAAHYGNITHAARTACKNRRAFFELIRKHTIDVERFRPRAPGLPETNVAKASTGTAGALQVDP